MLPTPDPDQASWLAKASAAVAGFAATCWGVIRLLNKKDADVVKGHGASIDELFRNQREDKMQLQATIDVRASALADSIQRLSDTQRLDREAILTAIREDRYDTHAAIRAIKDGFAKFSQEVVHELGRRPTREELPHGMLYQSAKEPPK